MSHRQQGMTLIEALLGITIMAMVSTLIFGGFSQTSKNKSRVENEIEYYHGIQQALNRMASDLSMAYVSVHVNPTLSLQNVQTAFVGTDRSNGDRLDFTAFSHVRLFRDAHESDQEEVSYFVAPHPSQADRKVLARRESRRVDDKPRTGGPVRILLDNVRDLQITYLDPITNEWLSTWDTVQAAMQPNRLPSQIKIVLVVPDLTDPSKNRTFATRATVRIRYALNHAVYNP